MLFFVHGPWASTKPRVSLVFTHLSITSGIFTDFHLCTYRVHYRLLGDMQQDPWISAGTFCGDTALLPGVLVALALCCYSQRDFREIAPLPVSVPFPKTTGSTLSWLWFSDTSLRSLQKYFSLRIGYSHVIHLYVLHIVYILHTVTKIKIKTPPPATTKVLLNIARAERRQCQGLKWCFPVDLKLRNKRICAIKMTFFFVTKNASKMA